MRLMQDTEATITEMESVIATDSFTVWKLLEVIKAPAFSGRRKKA